MAIDDDKPRTRWDDPILKASLVLNFLIIGALVGTGVYAYATGEGVGCAGRRFKGLTEFVETLPPDRRARITPVLEAERAGLEPLYRELRRVRRDILDIMAEDPIDRGRLDAALGLSAGINAKILEKRAQKVSKVAEHFTPEERQGFKAWWLRHRSRVESEKEN